MSKDVHYYMSKGMERKVAEYFASGIKKIISVNPNKDYTLTLSYDDGSIRLYDCKPFLLKDTVFEPFMDSGKGIAEVLYAIVGRGEGSGMAVMFLCTGVCGFTVSIVSCLKREIKELD